MTRSFSASIRPGEGGTGFYQPVRLGIRSQSPRFKVSPCRTPVHRSTDFPVRVQPTEERRFSTAACPRRFHRAAPCPPVPACNAARSPAGRSSSFRLPVLPSSRSPAWIGEILSWHAKHSASPIPAIPAPPPSATRLALALPHPRDRRLFAATSVPTP